jgi:hypothetical protein
MVREFRGNFSETLTERALMPKPTVPDKNAHGPIKVEVSEQKNPDNFRLFLDAKGRLSCCSTLPFAVCRSPFAANGKAGPSVMSHM